MVSLEEWVREIISELIFIDYSRKLIDVYD